MMFENCTKLLMLVAGAAGLFSAGAFAAPANPVLRTVDNGGDSLSIRTIGDEHYRFTQTEDGFLVVSDTTGVYYFAGEDGKASKFKAKNENRRSAETKAFLNGLDRQKVRGKHRELHPDRLKRPDGHRAKRAAWVPTAAPAAESSESADENVPPVLMLPKAGGHANGTNRFPVLLIENGSVKNLDSAALYPRLNQENYTQEKYTGSVRDYFVDQSSGRFVPTFDLYFVTVDVSFSSYIGNEAGLIQKGISALKSKYTSFNAADYDSDNDGDVDALLVLFAGGEVKSGDKHLGGFQYEFRWNSCGKQDAGNGKKFNSYFIIQQKEFLFPTFIHEFSHTMGLKDHYCVYSDGCYSSYSNTQYQAPGAHAWDVMATGMYNNGGLTPPNYSAFERNFMGWLDYTTLEKDTEVKVLPPLGTNNYAYYLKVSTDEWFVFENRQKIKWDKALPNSGMLIWHIDYDVTVWNKDALNDDPAHQRVDVVEAGNLKVTSYSDGFVSNGGSHLRDDPFPGSQSVTELVPLNAWNGNKALSGVYSITVKDTNVCFAISPATTVGDCQFVQSSSSEAVLSSSSEEKSSSSAVSSSSSAVLSSSSTVQSSSSKWQWRSSSSEAVSSSSAWPWQLSSSSTVGLRGVAGAVVPGFGIRYEAGVLNVSAPVAGVKTLRIFDAQGHQLFSETFSGMEHGVALRDMRYGGTHGSVLVVRVDAGEKLLGYGKVVVH